MSVDGIWGTRLASVDGGGNLRQILAVALTAQGGASGVIERGRQDRNWIVHRGHAL